MIWAADGRTVARGLSDRPSSERDWGAASSRETTSSSGSTQEVGMNTRVGRELSGVVFMVFVAAGAGCGAATLAAQGPVPGTSKDCPPEMAEVPGGTFA